LNPKYYLSLCRDELPRHSISNISIKLNNYFSASKMNALILKRMKKQSARTTINSKKAQQQKYRYHQCISSKHVK